jgi:hypothetical protein
MFTLDIQRLVKEIEASDPRDARHQGQIYEQIIQLRDEFDRARAADLSAYLDSAAHLTNYLMHMGRMGPEEINEIIARLVRKVEETFVLGSGGEEPVAPGLAYDGALDEAPQQYAGSGADEKLLGEIMLQLGFITAQQLEKGLVTQRATDQRIGEALVAVGAATWEQVREAIAVQRRLRTAIPLGDGTHPGLSA